MDFGQCWRRIRFIYSWLLEVWRVEDGSGPARRIGGFQALVVVFNQGQGLIGDPILSIW